MGLLPTLEARVSLVTISSAQALHNVRSTAVHGTVGRYARCHWKITLKRWQHHALLGKIAPENSDNVTFTDDCGRAGAVRASADGAQACHMTELLPKCLLLLSVACKCFLTGR